MSGIQEAKKTLDNIGKCILIMLMDLYDIIIQIFVVDSLDDVRVGESNDELNALLAESKLDKVPFLIFANKQDVDMALPADDVI